ncbi:hypothetical protein [Leifsonia sp. Root112D2]|uniref:hypothetical protein n=1 Tax=Leifsonia sp. Root112D2 TaxID=1736426 RepID=UPI0006FDD117|nr:hypothetical protein [Leifsonia sp. Root112D2]KQV05983.1 hypothetical protein ASC63_00295 [Leifsonia sp. Root112D2]
MHDDTTAAHRRPLLLSILAGLLWAEAALLTGIAVWLLIELLTTRASSFAGGLAILVLAVIAAVWLSITAFNTLRARSWVRAAAVTWQVLQIAVAIGLFQGADARPGVAWALLVPALAGIALAVSPSVIAATARIREPEDDGTRP